MNKKIAGIRIDAHKPEQGDVINRYCVGSKIANLGVVKEVREFADYIIIVFEAAANAVLSVYGSVKDWCMFRFSCTLQTSV